MSKKFYAVHRVTGERWKPPTYSPDDYLMMWDSGYLAVVSGDFYTYITELDSKEWKTVTRFKGEE